MLSYVTQHGDPALSTPSADVIVATDDDRNYLLELASNLSDTICAHKALGLAAVQIGVPVRMFVMRKDMNKETTADNLTYVVNPVVIETESTCEVAIEGCLSFTGVAVPVRRPLAVRVSYVQLDGTPVVDTLRGLAARCFLHEFDHLNGVVFTDRVSSLERKLALKRHTKVRKKMASWLSRSNVTTAET